MKLAIQTILWGPNPPSMEDVLREAHDVGYEGVEVFQHPSRLGSAADFYTLLHSVGDLALVGLSGGSIQERVDFARDFRLIQAQRTPVSMAIMPQQSNLNRVQPYVYADEAEEVEWFAENALGEVSIALHPHMFKSVQTAKEARDLLQTYTWLKFLPDPAHLKIAGDRPVEVVEEFYDRLAGVHTKDWTAEFGRAYQFYAQGFTDLGSGDADLQQLMRLLKSKRYTGWLIVERDISSEPRAAAQKALRWIQSQLSS